MAGRQWQGSTFGNGWMHEKLICILRHTDVRILYAFCYVFVVPVCLIVSKGRTHAYNFFRKGLGEGVVKSCLHTVKNFCMFSQVVIDRFAMYAGKKFEIEIVGQELFEEFEKKDEAFLQLSSHIGNYEIAGYSLKSDRKEIHAIVFSHEKESVMKNRNSMFVSTNVSMIALQEDMSHLFEIDKAICKGDIISFPSDRHLEGAKCISVDFLGRPAKFPQGPFSVAAMRGIDALAVNVMKTGTKKYTIYLTGLPYDRTLPRKRQTEDLCREYVNVLEKTVRQYPAQWYNYFDFWA